jgi:DNA-binding HxlR family transcriptional regulator
MAQARRSNPISDCPITAAMAAMGSKWKLIILYWLAERPRHFAALRQVMPPISQKVLTEQLRELIAEEIVHRDETGPVPAPVIYSLTGHGRSLLPVMETIRAWGRAHIERFEGEIRPSNRPLTCGDNRDPARQAVSG